MVGNLATGRTCKEAAALYGHGTSWGHPLKLKLAPDFRGYLGEDAIGDSVRPPAWRGNIVAGRERSACRAERMH